ncbi:protein kinase domain-containing protein [Gemmobacter caeruleus]|uniref:protein kinase domain-containing protein n=1 Tax=Gemmobacter caeruleus TaxID=2595004 RepID=UPI0011EEE972|nr:serine/threonine-protein kinase [Gemmobacter caeruleus]
MIEALPGDIFQRGQVLNNTYEIEGVLGRGGTGEVYRARNLISGRVVAIKALNAQFSGQDGYIELMRREEQMRDIRDDAVVRYTECSRSDQGHVFLVMDYIAGPSIADLMQQRRLEPRELMIIAHRIAEGLTAAHRQGIVHRDLSPDNVILRDGSPERATIIDFGIAKDTAAGARTIVGNDFAGKYEYAAPEQLEGRAEPRSDLYALGALLLAAYRGQIPFAGQTPGEMIRRKQEPLETQGLPEPLKGLIEWLSAPKAEARAPSAAAVVAQLDKTLKGGGAPETRAAPPPRRKEAAPARRGAGWLWLLLPVVLGLGGAGAWIAGVFDPFLTPTLPVVSPYTLEASAPEGGAPQLAAHAPDAAGAAALRAGFAALAGAEAPESAVTLAAGAPAPDWPQTAAAGFAAAKGVQDWSFRLSDRKATVTGLAPDARTAETIRAALEGWARAGQIDLSLSLTVGPKLLGRDVLDPVLESRATCGRLSLVDPPAGGYPFGATIAITGAAPDTGLATDLQLALRDIVGDRTVAPALTVLNPDLCAVRQVLPDVPGNALSVWLGQGATGEANLTGVYHKGDNPVVEVLAPATLSEGRLWVMAVDNTGKVFNLVPNMNAGETALSALGTVADGVRRVRVLWSVDEFKADRTRLAMQVTDRDFGKSEILAILTREDLFDTRRPRDESIASFAESLAVAQKERPGNIIGLASRLLESRP